LLLRVAAAGLANATTTLRLIILVDLGEWAHGARLLVLRVRAAQHAIEILGSSAWARALALPALYQALFIWQLAPAAWLLATRATSLLREQLISLAQILGVDRLCVGEALLLRALVQLLGRGARSILRMEHVLNVLRVVLRGIRVRLLLLVGQLDWSSAVEKL